MQKHSVTIRGHRTSLSLEPIFWRALKADAATRGLPLAQLIAHIDEARIARKDGLNLSSAIRVYLFENALGHGSGKRDDSDVQHPG